MLTGQKTIRILVLAILGTIFFATRVFIAYPSVRIKAVQDSRPAVGGAIDVTVKDEKLGALSVPFALIARIRNGAATAREFHIEVDGTHTCAVTIAGGVNRRVDCVVSRGWTERSEHRVAIHGADAASTLEYLELATHHGHSTGMFTAVFLPVDSRLAESPRKVRSIVVLIGLALLLLLEPRPPASRAGRRLQLTLVIAVVGLVALVWLLPLLSPYRVVLAPRTFVLLVLLATLSRTWRFVAVAAGAAGRRLAATAVEIGALTQRVPRALVYARELSRAVWTAVAAERLWLVVIVATMVAASAARYGARAVGGSDEYGYVSQAELWRAGNLKIDQPFVKEAPWRRAEWMFSPHGYRPHPDDPSVLVPIYAPGLPMLLAVAKSIGGQEAMFYVVPLSAGLLILGTYALGRRLGAEMAGFIAALLVAASPVVLFMSTAVMTDVPVAAAWVWAFYFLLGRSLPSAVAAGLMSSLAVLIRPNLAPLAGLLALHYVLAMRSPTERRRTFLLLIGFCAAMLPGVAGVAAINDYLYGSPFSSGYGGLTDLFVWARVPINVRQYLQWFAQTQTPLALCGFLALFVPLRRLWPEVPDRGILLIAGAFVVGVWGIYCAWIIFDAWWFSRFLLPSWPFILLGAGSVAVWAFRSAARWARPLVVATVLAVGFFELTFPFDQHPFRAREGRRRFVAAARLVYRMTERNSVIVSDDHSGSIRYYGGRTTMNASWIPPGLMLDRIVDWQLAHGVRTYLAAEDFELPEMRKRFAGNNCMRALEAPPLAILDNPGKMLLFDLTEPRSPDYEPIVDRDVDVGPTATPVPLPRLVYRDGQ